MTVFTELGRPTRRRTLGQIWPGPKRLIAAGVLALAMAGAAPSPSSTDARASAGWQPVEGWAWPLEPLPSVEQRFALGPEPWSPGHRGVDLAPQTGGSSIEVRAAHSGMVSYVGVVAGVPNVSITHESGWRTTYQPVEAVVHTGDLVAVGEVIGTLAPRGNHCAAACLHWGLISDGDPPSYLDPLVLMGKWPVVLLPPRSSR